MDDHEVFGLPADLRARAKEAFGSRMPQSGKWVAKTYNTVLLLQEGILYLAGLAIAEYRGIAGAPDLEAEMGIASLGARPSLEKYSSVLRPCIEATGERSAMRPLLAAEFTKIHRLTALIELAETQPERIQEFLDVKAEELSQGEPPGFDDFLLLVSRFRNRGFAHSDWHRLDTARDFFLIASSVLGEVAEEFVTHPAVTCAWNTLRPATVTLVSREESGLSYSVRVIDDDCELEALQENGVSADPLSCPLARYRVLDRVLVREGAEGEQPAVIGDHRELRQGMRSLSPQIEHVVYAILADDDKGPGEALGALHRFAEIARRDQQLRKEWMLPSLVDDIVVSALQHFKFNGENDDEGIPKRAFSLLEFTSKDLPRRILRDADRFEGVAVRYPKERQKVGKGSTIKEAMQGSLEERRRNIRNMGFRKDEDSFQMLTQLTLLGERRALRIEALLALGKRKDPRSTDVLIEAAREHRRDPKIASCALIALASVSDGESVEFLVKFVTSEASYACTDAAAWALAARASEDPAVVSEHTRPLLELVKDRFGDPYTRGSVLYCLSWLDDPALANDFAWVIREEEDPFVVEDACAALAKLGDPGSVGTLKTVIEGDAGAYKDLCVKREAIRSLGVLGGEEARTVLEAYECPSGVTFVERVLDEALARCERELMPR